MHMQASGGGIGGCTDFATFDPIPFAPISRPLRSNFLFCPLFWASFGTYSPKTVGDSGVKVMGDDTPI